jgi:hypothetical protein
MQTLSIVLFLLGLLYLLATIIVGFSTRDDTKNHGYINPALLFLAAAVAKYLSS